MKFTDVIVIAAIVGAVALAIFLTVRSRRRGCCSCGSCPYPCGEKNKSCRKDG